MIMLEMDPIRTVATSGISAELRVVSYLNQGAKTSRSKRSGRWTVRTQPKFLSQLAYETADEMEGVLGQG